MEPISCLAIALNPPKPDGTLSKPNENKPMSNLDPATAVPSQLLAALPVTGTAANDPASKLIASVPSYMYTTSGLGAQLSGIGSTSSNIQKAVGLAWSVVTTILVLLPSSVCHTCTQELNVDRLPFHGAAVCNAT